MCRIVRRRNGETYTSDATYEVMFTQRASIATAETTPDCNSWLVRLRQALRNEDEWPWCAKSGSRTATLE